MIRCYRLCSCFKRGQTEGPTPTWCWEEGQLPCRSHRHGCDLRATTSGFFLQAVKRSQRPAAMAHHTTPADWVPWEPPASRTKLRLEKIRVIGGMGGKKSICCFVLKHFLAFLQSVRSITARSGYRLQAPAAEVPFSCEHLGAFQHGPQGRKDAASLAARSELLVRLCNITEAIN